MNKKQNIFLASIILSSFGINIFKYGFIEGIVGTTVLYSIALTIVFILDSIFEYLGK